jgi:hypothetical protein
MAYELSDIAAIKVSVVIATFISILRCTISIDSARPVPPRCWSPDMGVDAKLFDWSDEITADCPRKQATNVNDTCDAKCLDLPKVV